LDNSDAAQVFPIFFATWVVLALGSLAFFHFNKNAALKRNVWPIMTVGVGILFVVFVWLLGFRGGVLYFVVPATVLMTALNIKGTQFCDSCGKTLYIQNPFSKPAFCPACGSKLAA
jgi:hypothetical protein